MSHQSYIVVGPYQFDITMPFSQGDTLSTVEANVLNWHRADLINKIVLKWVRKAHLSNSGILSAEVLSDFQARVTELDNKYQFSYRHPPQQSFLDRELTSVALQELLSQGKHSPTPDEIKVAKELPEIQAHTRKLIQARFMDLIS